MSLIIGGVLGVGAAAYFFTKNTETNVTNSREPAPLARTVKELDATIEEVAKNAATWATLPNSEKLELLLEMHEILKDIVDEVGVASDKVRGYEGTVSEGMGYVMGLATSASYIKGLIETYTSLVQNNKPAEVISRRKVGGCEVVQTAPRPGMWEKATNPMKIELWGLDGKEMPQTGPATTSGSVCGVLCAGNFEGPTDVLHQMFIENRVVICKNHPINSASTDILHAKLLAPLAARGFVGLSTGPGIELPNHLLHHKLIDNWMMTGGCATFDAIVWGGAKGKAAGKKAITKECHAELGAASPYIITPGQWSDAEITYQARMLLGYKSLNSGHICASPQTILVDSQWPQAKQFVAAVQQVMRESPEIKPYYPGADNRMSAIQSQYPNAEKYDNANLVLVPDLDAGADPDFHVRTEVFAGALGFKFLDGNNDPDTFWSKAVEFCNEKCFGSLSCSLVIDPRTQKAMGDKFDSDVLGKLKWGTIAVNTWGGMGASNPYGVWGAHPGIHTDKDIQSGVGLMGNCLFVENIKKQVIYGQWADPGPPALFCQSWKTKAIGRAFGSLAVKNGFTDLLGLIKAITVGKY